MNPRIAQLYLFLAFICLSNIQRPHEREIQVSQLTVSGGGSEIGADATAQHSGKRPRVRTAGTCWDSTPPSHLSFSAHLLLVLHGHTAQTAQAAELTE